MVLLCYFFKARLFIAKIFQDPVFFSKKNTRPCLFLHDPVIPTNNDPPLETDLISLKDTFSVAFDINLIFYERRESV